MNSLPIPVPPAPILEHAVGYDPGKQFQYLAMWWEPCGDEVVVADGSVSFTGNWTGYLAYVRHHLVAPHLAGYNFGSSDSPAEYCLVIDLQERKAYIATRAETTRLLGDQWRKHAGPPVVITMQQLIEGLGDFSFPDPSMEEVYQRIEADQKNVKALATWLDCQERD